MLPITHPDILRYFSVGPNKAVSSFSHPSSCIRKINIQSSLLKLKNAQTECVNEKKVMIQKTGLLLTVILNLIQFFNCSPGGHFITLITISKDTTHPSAFEYLTDRLFYR